MTTVNCKFAFSSLGEKNEWHSLISNLKSSEYLPIELPVEFSENLDRLKRHGYSASLSYAPNVYEINKTDRAFLP